MNRSHALILCIALFFGHAADCNVVTGSGEDDVAEREERHFSTIAKYSADTSEEAIEKLAAIIRWTARENQRGEYQWRTFKPARDRLLEIPGVADYIKRRILALSAWENGESTIQVRGDRGLYFQTLALLPHPETVRVLGELLDDDRDPTKGAITDCTNYVPNSVNAALTLHAIGLQKPPVQRRYSDAWNDLPTWRLWFEQVQNGKEFSFVSDQRIYRLADKSPTVTRQEHRRSPANRHSSSEKADNINVFVILGLLGLVVAIAASKLFRRSDAA